MTFPQHKRSTFGKIRTWPARTHTVLKYRGKWTFCKICHGDWKLVRDWIDLYRADGRIVLEKNAVLSALQLFFTHTHWFSRTCGYQAVTNKNRDRATANTNLPLVVMDIFCLHHVFPSTRRQSPCFLREGSLDFSVTTNICYISTAAAFFALRLYL